jgi:two-component system sensor histidine kinase/response regulator
MRNVVALSALPAVWAGCRPRQVAEGLADALLSTLSLDLVYVRLPGQAGGQEIEVARTVGRPTTTDETRDIGQALASCLDGGAAGPVPSIPSPAGGGMLRLVILRIGGDREAGVLIAGSRQADFPGEEDRLLLTVGANQAAAVLQRQRAEEALRGSDERFRMLAKATNDAVWDWDLGANRVWWSEGVFTLFGYVLEQNEADPAWWLERVHPDDRAAVESFFFEVVRGQELSWVDEYRFRCADGSYKDVYDRGYVLRDVDGQAVRMIGAMLDITARKRAEEKSRESEHRWRGLTEALPQLVWTAMPDGACDYFSTQWTQHTGVPEGELLGWRWLDVLHPEDRQPTRQLWTASVEERGPYDVEYRVRRADGAYRWFKTRGVPIRDGDGRIVKWFGTCTDITDLRQTEEALRESEARFRGTFENAAVGIAHTDAAGRILRVNEKLCDILRYTRRELLTKTLWDLICPDDLNPDREQLAPLVRGDVSSFSRDQRYVRKDGSLVWVAASVSLQRDAAGGPLNTISVMRDITERKRLEKELRQARDVAEAANRAKDEFLANVSHEIRTPMNAILGMTELALATELTEDQRQCLKTVKSASDNLLGIINDLLDFSKIEAGKLELDPTGFSLRAALGDTLRALAVRAHGKGLELISHVGPDVPDALIGDAGRLRQVLLNLVGNAIKFTAEGEVIVEVALARRERRRPDESPLVAAPGASEIRFAVCDTGIGIPHEKQESIFRAFEQEDTSTTRRYGGTGLGLTIAARLVTLMGGTIAVVSEPGRGSTFTFTARFERQPQPPEPVGTRLPVVLHDLPVLVVDDNATNRHVLGEWLRDWQMKPVAVADGLAALDTLWDAVNRGQPYPLMLLDARMPDTDGLALAAKIRRRAELAATRIVLLTSGDRPGDLARGRALRIDAHLLKPIQQEELLETIFRVLRKDEGRRMKDDQEKTPASASDASFQPPPASFSLHILVAEDNEFNAQLLEQLLVRQGHRVRLANNGRAALALAEEGGFDLLLLDVHMPELDGFQVIQAIRERERSGAAHLPVIALTARSRKEDRERCLAAGMDDFLAKPVGAADLWAAIDRVGTLWSVRARGESGGTSEDGDGAGLATPHAGPGVIDPRAVLAACSGDATLLGKMCQVFRSCLPDRVTAVQDAFRDQDAPRLREAAHKLGGMAATFSTALATMASTVEEQAAGGGLDESAPLMEQLESMSRELIGQVDVLSVALLRHWASGAPECPPR